MKDLDPLRLRGTGEDPNSLRNGREITIHYESLIKAQIKG
jgi:hypothetical protein